MAAPAWKDDGDLYRRPLPTPRRVPATPMIGATPMLRIRRDSSLSPNSRPGSLSTLHNQSTSGSASTSTTRLSQAESLTQSSASSRSSYEIQHRASEESNKSSSRLESSLTPRAGAQGQPSQSGKPPPAAIQPRSLGGWLSRLHVRNISQGQPQSVSIGQLSENDSRRFNNEVVPRFIVLMRTIVQGSRYEYEDELAFNLENRGKPTVVISCRHPRRGREIEKALRNPQFSRYLQSLGWNAVTKVDPGLGRKGRSSRRSRGVRTTKSPPRPYFNVDVCMSSKAITATGALLMFTESGVDPVSLKYQEGAPVFSTCGGLILVNGVPMALTTKHAIERFGSLMLTEQVSSAKPLIDAEEPPLQFGTVEQYGKAFGFQDREYLADWLLINVNETLVLPNQVSRLWSRREMTTLAHPLNCVIHTSRWHVYGSFDGSQALISAGSVSTMQFVVHLGEELLSGDSGSWVTADGKLLGMVIAASSKPFQAYIDAAEDVFVGISLENNGATVSLPSAIENDLFRMKSQARQETARSLSIHGFTLQQLPDAIISTIKCRTEFTLGDTTPVWPLMEDFKRTDDSLGFIVGGDLPRYDPLATNAVPIRALIWLGMQVPVASTLRTLLIPRPKEDQHITELLQSAAGESLIVFMHALRSLVSLEDMPGFISSLLLKFEIPSGEVPSVRFLGSLIIACESFAKHRDTMTRKLEETNAKSPTSQTRIAPGDHTDFAMFLGAMAKLKPDVTRDVVLCMGPWNDWIHDFCQRYLDLAVWRWQSDDELSKEVLLWLEQEPPRPYPKIWMVDRPGPFRCRTVRNDTLDHIYTELIDEYYMLIENGSTATVAEPVELGPLSSGTERDTAIGPVFNAKTAWCLPLFVKRAAKHWKRRMGPEKLNMRTSSMLFRAANRWMIVALGRGISKTAMDNMYKESGYRIPRSLGEPPTRERNSRRSGKIAPISQPSTQIGYNTAPHVLDAESRSVRPRFDDRSSQTLSTPGIEFERREKRPGRERWSEHDIIVPGQPAESDRMREQQDFDDYPSRLRWSRDDLYYPREARQDRGIRGEDDYRRSQPYGVAGDGSMLGQISIGDMVQLSSIEDESRRQLEGLRRREEEQVRRLQEEQLFLQRENESRRREGGQFTEPYPEELLRREDEDFRRQEDFRRREEEQARLERRLQRREEEALKRRYEDPRRARQSGRYY